MAWQAQQAGAPVLLGPDCGVRALGTCRACFVPRVGQVPLELQRVCLDLQLFLENLPVRLLVLRRAFRAKSCSPVSARPRA